MNERGRNVESAGKGTVHWAGYERSCAELAVDMQAVGHKW